MLYASVAVISFAVWSGIGDVNVIVVVSVTFVVSLIVSGGKVSVAVAVAVVVTVLVVVIGSGVQPMITTAPDKMIIIKQEVKIQVILFILVPPNQTTCRL
jgi:hypothetical protein